MEKNVQQHLPLTFAVAGGKLSGLLVTAFEGQDVRVLCLENLAEFLVPLEQAAYISPLTQEWMEDYWRRDAPYPIRLREDGGFYDREALCS